VVPLVETMLTPAKRGTMEESIREWAASTLGPLQDPRAVAPLLAVLRDRAAPEMLRAAAAVSLAKLHAREAIPDLRNMAADRSAHVEYRKAAVGAIGELNDAASAEGLLRMLPATADLSFRLYVLGIVGDIAGANVLPELKKVEQQHPDEPVRDAAKEARERIDNRLGVK
jgi:HEAT repeat protein